MYKKKRIIHRANVRRIKSKDGQGNYLITDHPKPRYFTVFSTEALKKRASTAWILIDAPIINLGKAKKLFPNNGKWFIKCTLQKY